ncbi:hypothetical protein PENOC_039560 [Penicillium occitanis (nom. inval.)]|nr:hypothetical protein PENOC_039560 [Penicillium occitanis (nom. inval.)]
MQSSHSNTKKSSKPGSKPRKLKILARKRENSPLDSWSNESESNSDDYASMEIQEAEESTNSYNSDESYFGPDDHIVAVNEPTPNAALIILLQAISDLVFEPSLGWTLHPVRFCSRFRNGKFNAYTDGALRATGVPSVFSIVEAKRGIRTLTQKDLEKIQMQEGVEMASWIMSDRGDPRLQKFGNYVHGSRFLISQGKDRINLTVAEHHEQYLQYLDQTQHDPPITDTLASMKNLLELFPPYRKRKEDEKVRRARIKISNNLFRLWNKLVLFEDDSYIDPASLEDLNIKYEDLTFNCDGLYDTTPTPNFFQPSTKEYLRGLLIDKDDEETKRCLEDLHDRWIINNPNDPYETPPNRYTLCYWLRNWFQHILRKRPGDKEPVSLQDLSELKHYLDTPLEAWFSDDKPHIIMTMENYLPSEDSLLVAEILAFVAVMWNRLVSGDLYPEHNVVPMMIFTFSNDRRGRILQACYDSERLVIRKSKLYDFTTEEKCTESMEIFLQQLTGSLEGPTRILNVNTTHPKTPRTIKAARASSAAVDLARNDPIASNLPKPSNDAISAKDFATSNAPSGSDISVPSNDTATSDSPIAINASSDPDSDTTNATNASNDLNASNVPATGIASNQSIASDAGDGSNASHSRSSSSTHTFRSDDASKPTGSSGTPDTSFSSDSTGFLQSSGNLDSI